MMDMLASVFNTRETRTPEQLLEAVKSNNIKEVRRLLRSGIDVNKTDHEGNTVIMHAARLGDLKLLELLRKGGGNINMENPDGFSPIMYAAENGHDMIVKHLVTVGAMTHYTDRWGSTALMRAAKNNHKKVVDYLILVGVDVNKKDNEGNTALLFAANEDNAEIVDCLLEAGADPNLINDIGWTVLMAVINHKSKHFEKILQKCTEETRSAVAGENMKTTLMLASEIGFTESVERLVEEGANVNQKDRNGFVAIMYAAKHGHVNVIRTLVDSGKCKVNEKNNAGWTALMIAAENNHEDTFDALLDANAKINLQNSNGYSALMAAAVRGNASMTRKLLEKGAEVNMTDESGQTAAMLAIKEDKLEVEKLLLLERKCNLTKPNKQGETPFLMASMEGHKEEEIKNMLLKAAHEIICKIRVESDNGAEISNKPIKISNGPKTIDGLRNQEVIANKRDEPQTAGEQNDSKIIGKSPSVSQDEKKEVSAKGKDMIRAEDVSTAKDGDMTKSEDPNTEVTKLPDEKGKKPQTPTTKGRPKRKIYTGPPPEAPKEGLHPGGFVKLTS